MWNVNPYSLPASSSGCVCVYSTCGYFFGYVEVEDHHAEVVHYEGLPQLEGLAILHVSRPRPQEEQVQAADGQGGEGR